jgi:hypothetical protein
LTRDAEFFVRAKSKGLPPPVDDDDDDPTPPFFLWGMPLGRVPVDRLALFFDLPPPPPLTIVIFCSCE